ncbi:MAG: LemA family protein [Eubacteriales bacterium]|nr:LemA family protein [Eubacteriales bacterium]
MELRYILALVANPPNGYILLILIVMFLIIFWCIRTVNGFRKKEIRVQEGLSGVEVALTKRYDMLTKMFDTARSYMSHEKELFARVIELRQGMSIAEMNTAQQQMDSLSGKFFAVAEGYPELRSSDVFAELQRGIRDAEEHLQAARRLYNNNVTAYNTAIAVFPAKLLAGSRQPKEFFAADEIRYEDVKMTF